MCESCFYFKSNGIETEKIDSESNQKLIKSNLLDSKPGVESALPSPPVQISSTNLRRFLDDIANTLSSAEQEFFVKSGVKPLKTALSLRESSLVTRKMTNRLDIPDFQKKDPIKSAVSRRSRTTCTFRIFGFHFEKMAG